MAVAPGPLAAIARDSHVILLAGDALQWGEGALVALTDDAWMCYLRKTDPSGTTAAVYDPRSHRLTAIGAPDDLDWADGIAHLRDGRVLVIGGHDDVGLPKGLIWIWDPATSAWVKAPQMNVGRELPSLVSLADGRVLAAAGYLTGVDESVETLPSTEIYDPATDRWSLTGPLPGTLERPLLVALTGGQALAVGHAWNEEAGEDRLVTALYDPLLGAWTSVDPPELGLEEGLEGLVALPDGTALAFGGSGTAWRFDVARGWRKVGELRSGRTAPAIAVLRDGRVFVAGGLDPLRSAEVFDPDTGRSTKIAAMPVARGGAVAIPLEDGSVMVVGGAAEATGEPLIDDPWCVPGADRAVRWIP